MSRTDAPALGSTEPALPERMITMDDALDLIDAATKDAAAGAAKLMYPAAGERALQVHAELLVRKAELRRAMGRNREGR